MSASIEQRNQDATCYTGNLDALVTEALLWEVSSIMRGMIVIGCGEVLRGLAESVRYA